MTPTPRLNPTRIPVLALALALAALLIPAAAHAGPTKVVAKRAESTMLGKTILANTKGRTLYSLSAETKGKFICTASCLSIWHPLVVRAGIKPTGPVKLGTVERPDGRAQVTYKGRPLYSFSGDAKTGEANGEGIRDVGTWHATVLGRLAPQPKPEPQPSPAPSPSPYPSPY
jgi:predicted lipoprotein with Yx(FWY)xxD motif